MWRPRKRQKKIVIPTDVVCSTIIGNYIDELLRNPLTVKHEINRNIPRPSRATLIAKDGYGHEYRQWLDMSYKRTMFAQFPVEFMTGRKEDIGLPPLCIYIELDYPEVK